MKEILLTQGKVAIIDDGDYERVSALKWHAFRGNHNSWAAAHTPAKGAAPVYMNRFILGLSNNDGQKVEYRDGNPFNCQRANLRVVARVKYTTPTCRTCGATENLQILNRVLRKNGSTWVRYICPKCTRERAQRYRDSPRGKAMTAQYKKSQAEQFPEKWQSRFILNRAVKAGKVIKTPCVVCGEVRSQGHHEDYSKPLEVVWLCTTHHNDAHRALRQDAD